MSGVGGMKAQTELQHEVEQRVGRNLLRYQLIELRLKAALPLRSITLSEEGLASLKDDIEATQRQTLGILIRKYVDVFEHTLPKSRESLLALLLAYVEARNWLVHLLLGQSEGLRSLDACRRCIERLDSDYAKAEDLALQVLNVYQFSLASVQTFLSEWAAAKPGVDGMIELGQRYAAKLGCSPVLGADVELQVSVLAMLEEVMGEIEKGNEPDDEWAYFDHVGRVVRGKYRDVPKGLLAMARQLDGFEFELRKARSNAGEAWMFRRRPEADKK